MAINQVRYGLSAPVLVKEAKSRRYQANFDPYIMESIRECEYMYKLGLSKIHLFHPKSCNLHISLFYLVVPDCGKIIVFCKDKILYAHELLKYLIERNDTIRQTIPKLFIPLMGTLLLKMENAFMPGFSTITWTSLKIPEFCDEITDVLDYIQVFVKDVRCYTTFLQIVLQFFLYLDQ